jgi:hypothetical protein
MIFTELVGSNSTRSSTRDEEKIVSILDKKIKNKNGEKEIKMEMGMIS